MFLGICQFGQPEDFGKLSNQLRPLMEMSRDRKFPLITGRIKIPCLSGTSQAEGLNKLVITFVYRISVLCEISILINYYVGKLYKILRCILNIECQLYYELYLHEMIITHLKGDIAEKIIHFLPKRNVCCMIFSGRLFG